jgi:hypothetical protein
MPLAGVKRVMQDCSKPPGNTERGVREGAMVATIVLVGVGVEVLVAVGVEVLVAVGVGVLDGVAVRVEVRVAES